MIKDDTDQCWPKCVCVHFTLSYPSCLLIGCCSDTLLHHFPANKKVTICCCCYGPVAIGYLLLLGYVWFIMDGWISAIWKAGDWNHGCCFHTFTEAVSSVILIINNSLFEMKSLTWFINVSVQIFMVVTHFMTFTAPNKAYHSQEAKINVFFFK